MGERNWFILTVGGQRLPNSSDAIADAIDSIKSQGKNVDIVFGLRQKDWKKRMSQHQITESKLQNRDSDGSQSQVKSAFTGRESSGTLRKKTELSSLKLFAVPLSKKENSSSISPQSIKDKKSSLVPVLPKRKFKGNKEKKSEIHGSKSPVLSKKKILKRPATPFPFSSDKRISRVGDKSSTSKEEKEKTREEKVRQQLKMQLEKQRQLRLQQQRQRQSKQEKKKNKEPEMKKKNLPP